MTCGCSRCMTHHHPFRLAIKIFSWKGLNFAQILLMPNHQPSTIGDVMSLNFNSSPKSLIPDHRPSTIESVSWRPSTLHKTHWSPKICLRQSKIYVDELKNSPNSADPRPSAVGNQRFMLTK
jgi:hypothetical protein